jgi:hypothetical protein
LTTLAITGSRAFAVLVVAMLAAGATIRLTASGTPASAQAAAYAEIDATQTQALPAGGPQRAVVQFYRAVIRGRYDQAFAVSAEARWRPGRGGQPELAGVQNRHAFVAALNDEIGEGGMRVGVARFAVGEPMAPHRNDLMLSQVVRALSARTAVGRRVVVPVSGRLVGMCEISGFRHRAVVAQVNGRWTVLLPGQRHPNEPHFEQWFLDRNRI